MKKGKRRTKLVSIGSEIQSPDRKMCASKTEKTAILRVVLIKSI